MKKIKLFDYQEDMVKRVQEAFKHHDAVMVQMPTGTGKTMVLANIVFSFLEKGNHPIWIVAHRRELVEQIKETLNKSLLNFNFSNHPVKSSKITPSLFTIKEDFSKITPSLFTLKEGSTSHPDPLSSGAREKTALLGARNRYALRLADHQRSRQIVRDGTALLKKRMGLLPI